MEPGSLLGQKLYLGSYFKRKILFVTYQLAVRNALAKNGSLLYNAKFSEVKGRLWIQCMICSFWAQTECARVDDESYVSDFCQ